MKIKGNYFEAHEIIHCVVFIRGYSQEQLHMHPKVYKKVMW